MAEERLCNPEEGKQWEFWIDVGGTFTDCLAKKPDGTIVTYKLLSSGVTRGRVGEGSTSRLIIDRERMKDPPHFYRGYRLSLFSQKAGGKGYEMERLEEGIPVEEFDRETGALYLAAPLSKIPEEGMLYELHSGEEAPVTGIRWLMGLTLEQEVGEVDVRLGTTRGTNALLERKGAEVAFVTTEGFGEVLEIGFQNRPHLFELDIKKPLPLYSEAVELRERLDSEGRVLAPLSREEVEEKLFPLRERGIEALAVCLLHSYRDGRHEQLVKEVAEKAGFRYVSCSSELVPIQKIVARGETAVVDAYLTPAIRDYVQNIYESLPQASVKMMTSAGGLVDAEKFVGKDSILSGPAGGVVGYAHVARQAGFCRAIGFDMGGTSTDVSRFDGDFEFRFEMELHDPGSRVGVRLISPMLWIETVAAGGGSVCWFDGQLPRVGPHSAGADPGPACYGRGGPLTITDVNMFLGRVLSEHFAFPLNHEAVKDRLDEISGKIHQAGQSYSREELAAGFARIANNRIAGAIKKISLARGYDVRDYALVTFGGAGAQHACPLARELGIKEVLLHPYGSILSAYGMGMADVKKFSEQTIGRPCNREELIKLDPLFGRMEEELREAILQEGIPEKRIAAPRRMLELRYTGQDWALTVPEPEDGDYRRAFEERHRLHYGFIYPGREIEIHAARLELVGETEKIEPHRREMIRHRPRPQGFQPFYAGGKWQEASIFYRKDLYPGARLVGPALIAEQGSTITVDPGWEAEVTEWGHILLLDRGEPPRESDTGTEVDLIALQLFNSAFSSIAEQMGATLQKTALSTNVKERMDFSCAVFTAGGELVANAPHIPVHLGAMPASVRHIIRSFPHMRPGEVYITNDPLNGGSHLPDVTVVTPVFDRKGEELLFFTASRAHHAEIGGISPGSMPPFARNLAEEGVLIRAFPFVSEDRASEERLAALLKSGPYPSRAPRENISDVRAQVAANRTGAGRLLELVERYGLEVVKAYMGHIQEAAEKMMCDALLKMKPGEYFFRDHMDDGTPLAVNIKVSHAAEGAEITLDFQGTGGVVEGSLNANRAIVTSAVLYCLRCLIEDDIPLNEGVLQPMRLFLPENSLLNPPPCEDPRQCAAVAGGNVETSQRVVDVVLGALGICAASQGTMNNLAFGSPSNEGEAGLSYYETIGGGAGAGPGYPGASAIHTHMTNTRLTDPEVLEERYPVRLNRFCIRWGSGGSGRYGGGDGIIREIEFLESLRVSLLTGRRHCSPYGLAGGGRGSPGRNVLIKGKHQEELGWAADFTVQRGDILVIETPGGGGYGSREG